MPMIDGAENIQTLFAVFHDGSITAGDLVAGTLRLDIEIRYLAERINPGYTSFQVALHEVSELSFRPWDANPTPLHNPAQIFVSELEILDCASDGELLTITCNQADSEYDYGGGLLMLQASAASVLDEGGRGLSLAKLIDLATAYWEEWEATNAAHVATPPHPDAHNTGEIDADF
jgi:hypothetical protein